MAGVHLLVHRDGRLLNPVEHLVADARYVRGAKLLMADRTLGGLVKIIREIDCKWEREQAEVQIIALVVTYEVEFTTSTTDPSVPGF